MGMGTRNTSAITKAANKAQETGGGERAATAGKEEGGEGRDVGAGGEIAPDGLGGRSGDRENTALVALAHHRDVAIALVKVADEKTGGTFARFHTDLGGAGAGIKEQEDEGAVAVGGGAAVNTLALAGPGV